jgi:GNAT superfamily N-acetyltransferase
MAADERTIRPATPEDVPAIRAILAAHGNDGPVGRVDIVGPYVRHLILRHRVLVTELGPALVAFGAVAHAGVADHLADLFVAPDRLGQGLGRPLLAALFAGADRRTTFASDDPRALPSYVRAGMAPWWVQLYLTGDAARLPATRGLDVEGSTPAALAALELAWTGVDRAVDHEHWAAQAESDPFLVVDDEGALALAYARARQVGDLRVINRLLVRPGADPVPAIILALRRAGGGGPVECVIPGPNPALPVLLDHGFRITDRDQFLASDPGIIDPVRRLPNSGML